MGGADGDADIDALLREFPALGRTEDGRVRCALTGHVMACKPEVVRPYVKGKKFAAALAKEKEAESLKEYEPHIVRSKFLPASSSVASPAGTSRRGERGGAAQRRRRFARGVEMLTDGSGAKLLTEQPRARRTRSASGRRRRRAAAAEKRGGGGGGGETRGATSCEGGGGSQARRRARAHPRERRVLPGDGLLGTPAHVIYSDSELEDDDEEEEGSESASDSDSEEDEEGSESASDSEEDEEGSESASDSEEDDVLMPTVRAPNFAKIMARVKSSAKRGGVFVERPKGAWRLRREKRRRARLKKGKR